MLVTLDGIVMLVSEVAEANADKPMLVTLDGMVIVVNENAHLNAFSLILVTLDGIVMLEIPELENASSPMLVTPAGITTIPLQLFPKETTPSVIVKLGPEDDGNPVVHRYVPLGEYASTTSPFQSAGDPVVSKPAALDFTYAFAPAATL